jgi:hypothetical protein
MREQESQSLQGAVEKTETEYKELLAVELPIQEELEEKLEIAQAHNEKVTKEQANREEKDRSLKQLLEAQSLEENAQSEKLALQRKKNAILTECCDRIAGLSFNLDIEKNKYTFLFNGQPLSNLSAAETIKFGFALQKFSNPQIKVCLIKDASLLDQDSLEALCEEARENDFQLFLEIVANEPGEDLEVYMVDGNNVI